MSWSGWFNIGAPAGGYNGGPATISRNKDVCNIYVRGNDNAVTGTGLGLFIVRTIVDAHHGRIWCESDPGRRTAFVLELPLVDAHRRAEEGQAPGALAEHPRHGLEQHVEALELAQRDEGAAVGWVLPRQ